MRRGVGAVMVLALLAAACSSQDEAAPESSTFISVTTIATTTSTLYPNGPAILTEGDTGPYVVALQALLNCGGHGDLTVDGVFGPATTEAVIGAQATAFRQRTGDPDEDMFAALSRACSETRTIEFTEGEAIASAAGNAAPGDPETFSVTLVAGWDVVVASDAAGTEVGVTDADGGVVHEPDGSQAATFSVPATGDYTVTVIAEETVSFVVALEVPVRVGDDEDPLPTETVASVLDGVIDAVAAGDLPTAMLSAAPEVTYHGRDGATIDGEPGRTALLGGLTDLAATPVRWQFDRVGFVDGDVAAFSVVAESADPEVRLFAARLADGYLVEWWEQPESVVGVLSVVLDRAAEGDLDGAMTLFAAEVAFRAADGTVTDGADGRAAVRSWLAGTDEAFAELLTYEEAVATFQATTNTADSQVVEHVARFDGPIVEWWVTGDE